MIRVHVTCVFIYEGIIDERNVISAPVLKGVDRVDESEENSISEKKPSPNFPDCRREDGLLYDLAIIFVEIV